MNEGYTIRFARVDELAALQQIELAASRLFAEIGLDQVAENDPLEIETLRASQSAGLVWVAVDEMDCPVGFLAAGELDGTFHIEEIDVHPAHGRRGLGKRLIETACAAARRQGYEAITLTTFRDVPWNAPFYEGIGFRVLEDRELGKELSALRQRERLEWYPLARVCMSRDLSTNREAPEIQ
jgi:ribosomal protein S18 acetylase RimI-like enzyme